MMIMPNNSATPGHSSQVINNFVSSIHQQNPTMLPSNNPWTITPLEHQSNEGQFIILHPIGIPPMIGGDQARPFFLKSGLPATILAQIWQLADMNKDGKLDRLEFSIAMKLVRNCLAGIPLPPTLPDSMRQISGMRSSASLGQFNGGGPLPSADPVSHSQPQMPPRPMSTYGTMPAMNSIYRPSSSYGGSYSAAQTQTNGGSIPFQMGTKELGDWTLPHPVKLRFCQQFNQLDRSRIGLLTGQQARGVLGESQLSTQLLAQIWNMSDVNKDGCLSIEEFCTAQFLIEMVKSGYALPPKLPNELLVFCNRSKTVSPSTVASTPTDPNVPPPQKGGTGHFKTFEDKRRDNLDKGQAELDRRRQILREEEERRRAEIERREREEAERKERERQELERRREAEMELERQKELERERERAAEEEKMKAHREEARRRLEIERIKELEKIRIKDLENQLQAETEKTTQIQQRQKTMAFQLQAFDERSQQLNTEIIEERDKILKITQEIEGMREKRDEKCAKIQEVEKKARELNVQSERFGHENLQLQSECQRQLSRANEIEALRNEKTQIDEEIKRMEKEIQKMSERTTSQEKLVIEKRPDWEQSCKQFRKVEKEHQELVDRYDLKRREIHPSEFVPRPSSIPPQYEMPPDAVFGSTTERQHLKRNQEIHGSGFDNNFAPDFPINRDQKSIDDEGRRKSENSIGNVTAIAAKLQQQLQFNQPLQQKQTSLSREGSVTSITGGKPSIQPSSSMEAFQQQQFGQLNAGTNLKTVKYRALYEFMARSGDELSLQPGDVIMVFEGHQSEPGWLAGQIRDKVGWFPASFAEPIASSSSTATGAMKKAGSLTGSPSGEPLASIQEEGELAQDRQPFTLSTTTPFQADFASAFSKSVSYTDPSFASLSTSQLSTTITPSRSTGAFTTAALYDLPPTEERKQFAVVEPTKSMQNEPAPPLYEMPPGDGISGISSLLSDKGEIIKGTGIALYQWKARNDQEMSFSRGDTIEVLEQGEMRWRGRLQKNRQIKGWFPKSYLKMDTNSSNQGGNDLLLKNAQERNEKGGNGSLLNEQQQRKASQTGNGIGEWFIALYEFDAVEATDLSLKPGDRIFVTDQKEQWWRGTCEDRSGIFPANYVQKASEIDATIIPGIDKKSTTGRAIAAFDATASNQISLRIGDIVQVHQMTPGGWWEGELERGGEKHTGWFPGNYIQVVPGDSDGKILALAAFDYQAQHDDELSFKSGDIIEVFDRSDGQWWKGRKQGDTRQLQPLLFPANFVQLR